MRANFQYVTIRNCVGGSKSALTSGDRYNSGFSHGEQQAAIDFQNNSPFNPVCVAHTTYYCAGYLKAYNVTWDNLVTKGPTLNPNPNPPAPNSTSPPASNSTDLPITSNTNTIAADSHGIFLPSTDGWVGPFVIFVSVVIIIAAIAWKLKHRRGKYKER